MNNFNIKINGHKIFPSEYIKYLGIYLYSTLSGKHHCELLSIKLKRANGMLSKIRHYFSHEELKSVYYAIFLSRMPYGCQRWGQSRSMHVNRISRLQNRAMSIINFEKYDANPDPLYKNNKALKFIQLQNCLLIHDYMNNILPSCFQDYNYISYNVQTRNSSLGCLFIPSKNTSTYGLKSITQQAIYNWNKTTKACKKKLINYTRMELKGKLLKHLVNY